MATQTLTTQISGGQAPDLANASAQFMGQMAGVNEAMPLDELLSKEFLANFLPSGIEAFTINGKLMAMPYFLDPRALLPQGSVREGGSEAAGDLGRRDSRPHRS